MQRYTIYGLCVEVPYRLPGVIAIPAVDKADTVVAVGVPADIADQAYPRIVYTSPNQDEYERPVLVILASPDSALFRFCYRDGVEFYLDRTGSRIWIRQPEAIDGDYIAIYLLGPILGFALRLRGIVSLHASAIRIGDRAIALVGPQGAGKSTTAAAFTTAGYPVLSDDLAPLIDRNDHFLIQPGYPRLRLWPESVHALYGLPEALPRLTPDWDKRYLDLDAERNQFQPQALPLAAIYLLSERSEEGMAPSVEPVPASAGLMTLIANTYTNYVPDPLMRAQEFEILGRVVQNVPLRRVVPHTDIRRLSRLCTALIDDFHEFLGEASPAIQDR